MPFVIRILFYICVTFRIWIPYLHTFLLLLYFHSHIFLLSYTNSYLLHSVSTSCKLFRVNFGARGEKDALNVGCGKSLWVHGIRHCWLICGGILKSFEGLKTWWWSRQWEILVVSILGVMRVETMRIVQWVAIGRFEVVCIGKSVAVIGRVCYIVTHQSEKLNNNEYQTHFVPWQLVCACWE